MVGYNFKQITVVPDASKFVDIVLTRTQRRTPTVVHKCYQISVLRKFYMRKVKFTQQTINDKFQLFLTQFPILDDIHPFYSDLMNVLYDKDHYKLALGQINNAKRLVDNISSDYIRLLKYGDSLYRCKQLKRAALGRMVKVIRRLAPGLSYLEEVRQHMARLPQIDPSTRSLLICGYPNVGKSSFMNKITRANVDVQPYAFTTKSLFVGHMDYKFLRWQVIDTPGILDHPIEDRNVIEMQAITALAHLRCSVLFFLDISEECSYSISQQVALFDSIAPLFDKKPLIVVLSKIDIRRVEDLTEREKASIYGISDRFPECKFIGVSSVSEEGISTVKQESCELLLALRAEIKLRGVKREDILSQMYVSMPRRRDDVERPAFAPPKVDMIVEGDAMVSSEITSEQKKLEYLEQQRLFFEMDPEYSGMDWKKHYTLEDDEWRYDKIPEILDGENIADWIDPNLEANWEQLENEEAELLRQLAAQVPVSTRPLSEEEMLKLALIRDKKAKLVNIGRMKKQKRNALKPLQQRVGDVAKFERHLESMGLESDAAVKQVKDRSLSRSRLHKRLRDQIEPNGIASTSIVAKKQKAFSSLLANRRAGIHSFEQCKLLDTWEKKERLSVIKQRNGRSGPGDRSIPNLRPKHLFSGKRRIGSTDRR